MGVGPLGVDSFVPYDSFVSKRDQRINPRSASSRDRSGRQCGKEHHRGDRGERGEIGGGGFEQDGVSSRDHV